MDQLTVTGFFRRASFLVAQHHGFFEREDLDISFHLITVSPDHVREMAEGKWPITLTSADTMLARATQDGIDFVAFLETEQGLDVQLVAQPEIGSLTDLRGKLFAADPVDSNYDLIRNKIMSDHGIAEHEYEYEIIGNSPMRLDAFLQKRVAAAMLAPPSTGKAVAAGGRILAEGADHVLDWPIVCGWGLRSWLEANRPIVVRFVRAMAAATDWLLAPENREATIQLVMREEKLTRENAENIYRYVVPRCALNMEALQRNLDLRIELGYYKPPHQPVTAFCDESYWREAVSKL